MCNESIRRFPSKVFFTDSQVKGKMIYFNFFTFLHLLDKMSVFFQNFLLISCTLLQAVSQYYMVKISYMLLQAVSQYYMVKMSIRSERVCKRPWNFERVPNKMLQGHDKALIFTSTKEACLAACLNEVWRLKGSLTREFQPQVFSRISFPRAF
jgi:hypothetical protein